MKLMSALLAATLSFSTMSAAFAEGRDMTTTVNQKTLSASSPKSVDGLIMGITLSSDNPFANQQPPAHSLTYQGLTFHTETYDALTNDSYLMKLGGSIHNHLIFDGSLDDWDISGDGFWLASSGPLNTLGTSRDRQLSAEWDTVISGNTHRFMLWSEKDGTTHLGLSTYVGAGVEPTQGNDLLNVGPGHKRQAELVWDKDGALSMCAAGKCSVHLTPNGDLAIDTAVIGVAAVSGTGGLVMDAPSGKMAIVVNANNAKRATVRITDSSDKSGKTLADLNVGAVTVQHFKKAALPKDVADGASVWCEDCVVSAHSDITGAIVYWHQAQSVWTDATNTTVR